MATIATVTDDSNADTASTDAATSQASAPASSPRRHSLKERRQVSPTAVMTVLGALVVALLMQQFNSLGGRIDELGERIDNQGTELRAEFRDEIGGLRAEFRDEIGGLRTEMQAGFREINTTLLDHTERLARLETAAGLPPPSSDPTPPAAAP